MAFRPYENQVTDTLADDGPQRWTQVLPIQQPYPRSVGSHSDGLTYAQHESLRQRKTPYGRQVEQLDIANIDESLRLPASKHVLLSVSPNQEHSDGRMFGARRNSNHGQRRRQQQQSQQLRPESLAPSVTSDHQLTASMHYEPAWNFPGGNDSTLMQNSPSHNRGWFYGSRSKIPTVMPSALHNSLGPTAPAEQQYYGPYWPDGTFSPYRPAPMRDDRFFHWRHSRDLNRNSERSVSANHHVLPQPLYDNDVQHMQQAAPTMVQGVRSLQSLPPRDACTPYVSFHDRISSALDSASLSHDFGSSQHEFLDSVELDNRLCSEYPDNQDLRPTLASERIVHRDRIFSWAYRVYIDLLAQIQRESKLLKQQVVAGGTVRPILKPTIFPRPPQRSTSQFSSSCESRNQRYTPWYTQTEKSLGNYDSINSPARPSTAIRAPRRASDFGTVPGHHQHYANALDPAVHADTFNQLTHPRQGLCGYAGPTLDNLPTARQFTSNAIVALDAVELLCQEPDSVWTDGMLLAGCLAYGIGDYNRALAWYQKVLKLDTKHVEAISNLGATLLALGRRDEAVNHWSAAVRLRPSYFEAIEHLVGLFVSTHRTREAAAIIEYVESCLKQPAHSQYVHGLEQHPEDDSDSQSRTSSATINSAEGPCYDYDTDSRYSKSSPASEHLQSFGNSGYAVPAADNGRLLALIHAKGNMLYSLGDNRGAALAFEDAILIATGGRKLGIKGLIDRILRACVSAVDPYAAVTLSESREPILLSPDRAQQIAQRMFPSSGDLPGLQFVPSDIAYRAAVSTTSNTLLSLAKIYQDGLCSQSSGRSRSSPGTREILALYYLSLSLQQSPSTANNVGILLASVHSTSTVQVLPHQVNNTVFNYTGVVPGSGVALALAYYNYGLNLDGKHAHLYTNLGSLLKDLGELQAAVKMYETAVKCDGKFDIALANLANAVKDQGRIVDAISYYKRAVQANPDFAEAVCGLATALNSVCDWNGRGGVYTNERLRDKIHVDENGMRVEAHKGSGWMNKVVEIVDKQLRDGEVWGMHILTAEVIEIMCQQLTIMKSDASQNIHLQTYHKIRQSLQAWAGRKWEGSRLVRLIERAIKRIGWQWYQDRYKHGKEYHPRRYARPQLPANMPVPSAPTVLPFHTFTTPLSAKQVRQISQRNALRNSVATLKSAWLPRNVYPPPPPPNLYLRVGYVSSDFNNHPLAHLMQSIFGLHNPNDVKAYCYATTASDGSVHRLQIEREAPVFRDASNWNVERLVNQIVEDKIHILVNLNGYTRGAKNEVFAARPAPIHMSFMGFAGTLGAEWCDYVYADPISVSTKTLAPYRYNVDIEDKLDSGAQVEDMEDWMYAENVIFSRSSFFCVDHKQSAPDARQGPPPLHDEHLRARAWSEEQDRRWKLRKELFPTLSDSAVILGNFNQLYKIDPTTFQMYLRILDAVPNAVLWLLRFPDIGEQNLMGFARDWFGSETASRIIFTDVAPKGAHITRASVVDLFLDTPECNAHTTAADVIWSGTPIVTWAKWEYKMCSRMASSIVASALPEGHEGDLARRDLLVSSEKEYEDHAIYLAATLRYRPSDQDVRGRNQDQSHGRLMELRRMLWEGRWTSRLFDTQGWVRNLEKAYWAAWDNWEAGKGGDIWL